MKKIPLSKGLFALVDDDDFEHLNQWKWWICGRYAGRVKTKNGKREHIFMHRVVNHTPNSKITDHINCNRLDNRKENLRNCNFQENGRNVKKYRGTSKYKGVLWASRNNRWKTTLQAKGNLMFIGYFKNEVHAALAYDLWAKDMYGEFVRTNFAVINHLEEQL
jgi:hypothetical protein